EPLEQPTIQIRAAAVAEAYDAEAGRRGELELRRRAHAFGALSSERDVLGDSAADPVQPRVLHRHPNLQRTKPARLLKSVLSEPRQSGDSGRAARAADVRPHEAEGRSHRLRVAHADESAFNGHQHPLTPTERAAHRARGT